MTALDFLQVCVGCGVIVACTTYAVKVVSDVRSRTKVVHDHAKRGVEEPTDPLSKQLHEFRNARFGRPMVEPPRTWPVSREAPAKDQVDALPRQPIVKKK